MKKLTVYLVLIVLSINISDAQNKFSISEKEVEIKVDDITLSGTLLMPESDKKVPLVILISGSFADNRDAKAYGFKPFRILADYLSSQGIASYRYDDRGIGKSTGMHTYQYTISELTNDAHAAINTLKKLNFVDTSQIGLIGHSMGGIMAPQIAYKNKDVSFIITLGSPYTNPLKMNLRTMREDYVQAGWEKKFVDKVLELHSKIKEVTVTGKGYDELMNEMKNASKEEYENLPEDKRKHYNSQGDYYKSTWYGLYEPIINTPFLKSWFESTPREYLEKLKCPALFLMGEFDSQANINYQGSVIINSLEKTGNSNYAIRQIPKTGHFFVDDWNAQEKTFVPGFLEVISNWIKEQSKLN